MANQSQSSGGGNTTVQVGTVRVQSTGGIGDVGGLFVQSTGGISVTHTP